MQLKALGRTYPVDRPRLVQCVISVILDILCLVGVSDVPSLLEHDSPTLSLSQKAILLACQAHQDL